MSKKYGYPSGSEKALIPGHFSKQSFYGLVKFLKLTIDRRMNVQIKKIIFNFFFIEDKDVTTLYLHSPSMIPFISWEIDCKFLAL